MREMRGEVGKKPLKMRWIIPYFFDVIRLIFKTLCLVSMIKDGNGFIDRRELSMMMRFMGESVTESEIQLILGWLIIFV